MPTPANVLALLERTDKWYLGGGRATLYAPAFPRFLDTPGFWDEAYFADIRLERLFCLLVLDERARPLTLRRALRRWTPDRLLTIYTVEGHPTLRIQEERVVTANDTLACRLTVTNSGTNYVRLNVLMWSLQSSNDLSNASADAENSVSAAKSGHTVRAVERDTDALSFAHHVYYGPSGDTPADVYGWGERKQGKEKNSDDVSLNGNGKQGGREEEKSKKQSVFVALGGSRLPESWTVNLAEMSDTSPLWQVSIFPEKFQNGTLPREMQAEAGWNPNGLLHLAQQYVMEAEPGGADSLTVGASLALDRTSALAQLREDMMGDVVAESRAAWEQYFASVPAFECDDPYLERYYWYRWYGLRLMTVDLSGIDREINTENNSLANNHNQNWQKQDNQNQGNLKHPCVFEGPGAFRSHVSYSAQCHMRETIWMRSNTLAIGSLLNFLDQQVQHENENEDENRDENTDQNKDGNKNENETNSDDGFLPGHLYLWRQDRGFYHTNWGATALQIYHLTGDSDFVQRVYGPLVRYAEYCDRVRDREATHLVDVLDQGETGQEYMSRYLFVEPQADTWCKIRMKGVDATCYLYDLQRALATFARVLGSKSDSRWWDEKADETRDAVRRTMWDTQAKLFKDVHPQTLERSSSKAAVGFYPFLSDIATRAHLAAWKHLQDPQTFGTPFPIPSSSVDDPYFDAQAEWKGKRANCPWNGRVWPMTNSHIADALANTARTLDPTLKPMAVDFILRFIRMMFHDGDPKRPNAYEHYNPQTGMPSLYRGVDDYQHSWVVDLIIKHVVGIQTAPGPNGLLVIDPLPFGLRRFRCENIPVRGHFINVSWSRETGFSVHVDGQEVLLLPEPQRVEIVLTKLDQVTLK